MLHRSLIALASLVAASLAAVPSHAGERDGSLVIGVAQFPASLNPYISSQTVQFYTIGFATRPISAFDVNGHVTCVLCTELPSLENGLAKVEELGEGKKGLAVTIKLKPDLTWSDGTPLTAKDVAFTFKLGHDPNAGFSDIYPWARAKSVDVVDDHTAVLHLDRTLATYQVWDYVLPEHIEGKVYSNPTEYITHTIYNTAPMTPGLWNGPYVISGYQSGNQIELTPNPAWKGRAPDIKRIVVRLIENTAALQANLLSGDVDMTPSGIGITTDQAVALQHDHPTQFAFFYHKGLSMERIDPQRDNPMLADLRVRQALLHAVDRNTLIQKLFAGHASIALTWMNDLDPNFTTDVAQYPFDPAKARALLKDAGYAPGPDGICRNAKGDRLSFEFSTTAGNRIRELSQQVMQDEWKSVCIEVTIHNEPSRTFFGTTTRERSYTGLAEYANSSRIGLVPTPFYGTAGIPTKQNNFNGMNVAGFSDPEMDRTMAAAEVELDPARQKVLWTKMQQIYAANLPELPLYFREDPDVNPTWLKGYEATGKEDYTSYWAENWHR
ncbi:MAG TPA: peptide ABC transporter substrate-binding protein [Acetobacteraceae bacterium]|jgi:peptide/nickel transport system substrate-binding protein|nr:peptide ABC transporter substrate-binding protein [Acetobacteraceae bacterium]